MVIILHTRHQPVLTAIVLLLSLLLLASSVWAQEQENDNQEDNSQAYRPAYHFTPPEMWMNDPNGLVYYDGEYHLFYQYHPDDTVWGPMHWGHAVSEDLVEWEHLPIALYPDELGTIFSGSAIIDWQNSAGFGKEAMIAIFTHHSSGNRQKQSLAYSTDKGRTWSKYEGNPVIDTPKNIRNFRDPKVFWYENGQQEQQEGHWVMVLAVGSTFFFYTSPDLKSWEGPEGFGIGYGAHRGVWETPDLFELPVDGGPETRWVLTAGVGNGAPAGGSGMQYFIGDFDGFDFTSENPKESVLWADYGADFYAAQSWSDEPHGRRIWAAWMNNWHYAQDIPTTTWRGALTLPRELKLTKTSDGIRLIQQPIEELQTLRSDDYSFKNQPIRTGEPLLIDVSGNTLEIMAEFQLNNVNDADRLGLHLHSGPEEYTTIGYGVKNRRVFIDRNHSGQVEFNGNFAGIHLAQMYPIDNRIRLHLFVDHSSVELFANDGQIAFTERIFPTTDNMQIEAFVTGGELTLNNLTIYTLQPDIELTSPTHDLFSEEASSTESTPSPLPAATNAPEPTSLPTAAKNETNDETSNSSPGQTNWLIGGLLALIVLVGLGWYFRK